MLKNISWSEYFTGVLIALVVYYLFIAIRFYSDEIKDLLSGKRKIKLKPALQESTEANEDTSQTQSEYDGFENTSDDEFEETEMLIDSLKTAIADGFRRELIPQEFKQSIISILKKYPDIKYSPLRPSINELIISECEKYQTTVIDKSEVDLLWREGM